MFLDEVDTLYGSLVPVNVGQDMFTRVLMMIFPLLCSILDISQM